MLIHTGFFRFQPILGESICRHGDNGDRFCVRPVKRANLPRGLIAIHDRHQDIHKDGVKFAGRTFCKEGDGLLAVPRLRDRGTLVLYQELGNFHVQLIILDQQDMQPADGPRRGGRLGRMAAGLCVDLKGNRDYKGRAYALRAFKADGAAHFLGKALCDGHAKTGAAEFGRAALLLLCKGLEDTLLKFLTHADAVVLTDELQRCDAAVSRGQFAGVQINMTVIPVVLDCVGHDVHQQPLEMDRTADQIAMLNGSSLVRHRDIAFVRKAADYAGDLIKEGYNIKRLFLKLNFARFQLAHVKNFTDKLKKNVRSLPNFLAAFRLFLQITAVMLCNIKHTADAVDRRADIVAHALQKFRLGAVGGLGLFDLLQQVFLVLPLLFLLLTEAFQLVPAQQLPDHQQHAQIAKYKNGQTLGQCAEGDGVGNISVDIVIALAQYDAIGTHTVNIQMHQVPAVGIFL